MSIYLCFGFFKILKIFDTISQFFGALNDNVFKALVQMFIIGLAVTANAVPLAVATMVFAIPFLVFTSYAGYLADRFSK